MKYLLIFTALVAVFAAGFSVAGEPEEHQDHEHQETAGDSHDEKDHGDEAREENPQVGPSKGILEAQESQGFKLSPEAEKNFALNRIKMTGATLEIPRKAIVTAVAEVNVFRARDGFYKRIDFEELRRDGDQVMIRSKDLRPGDEVVIEGLGFLRIAELAAFGGAPEGHSH